jgi:hypothetical protein
MTDRPGNGRPLNFVHYACGHSSPVRGSGGTVDRPCIYCAVTPAYCDNGRYAAAYRKVPAPGSTARDILGAEHTFSYDHLAECELCATRIP